jgi:hypothetical protein
MRVFIRCIRARKKTKTNFSQPSGSCGTLPDFVAAKPNEFFRRTGARGGDIEPADAGAILSIHNSARLRVTTILFQTRMNMNITQSSGSAGLLLPPGSGNIL